LILVILGGGELFTGNVLLVIAWLQKKISITQFLKNLSAVWV
jgi:formate/nitrite transporter FocA (FNT family)